MNQTLEARVQAATNFVINSVIPGSQNHQFILNLIFVLAFFWHHFGYHEPFLADFCFE